MDFFPPGNQKFYKSGIKACDSNYQVYSGRCPYRLNQNWGFSEFEGSMVELSIQDILAKIIKSVPSQPHLCLKTPLITIIVR
jgi:hypothetical protein